MFKLNVTSVMVLDQNEAFDFYVNKLGVRGLYETLKARGVTDFTREPTDHFYGADMGVRDPFGNAIRILQPAKDAQPATA